MKKLLLWSFAGILLASAALYGFTPNKTAEINDKEIKWYTIEEAMQTSQKSGKKIIVDMYTDWCGWCKVMDQKTFTNPEVIRYINENFIAVKFNAEHRDPIVFKGKKYEFIPGGRRGIHSLAYNLLNRNASYPSFVLLDQDWNRFGVIKGYKTPEQLLGTIKQKLAM